MRKMTPDVQNNPMHRKKALVLQWVDFDDRCSFSGASGAAEAGTGPPLDCLGLAFSLV